MPETPAERVIFTLGLIAIAVLGVLLGVTWHRHDQAAGDARPPVTTRTQTTVAASTPSTTTATTATVTGTSSRPARSAAVVVLQLRARGDTWMTIRTRSAHGHVLFTGTLTSGQTKTFRETALWARFGSAANVQARLDGVALSLPGGTYSALITATGLQKVA